jgi:hypothetical protein
VKNEAGNETDEILWSYSASSGEVKHRQLKQKIWIKFNQQK